MKFYKYQHLERDLKCKELTGILSGTLTIQPKLDGSNCQIWMENGKLVISSRTRVLGNGNDNAGCYQALKNDQRFIDFFTANPDVKLIGEWLVPHTIKYKPEAYGKLYIYDAIKIDSENEQGHALYVPYWLTRTALESCGIDHVPDLVINAEDWDHSYKQIIDLRRDEFNWLLPNPETDEGESIVVKNYGYTNPFGRKVWCKVINEEFYALKKEKKPKDRVRSVKNASIELAFIEKNLTAHLLSKQLHKLGEFERKRIGEYIRSCQLEFIEDFVTEQDDVDCKVLNNLIAHEARQYLMSEGLL